MYDRDHFQNHIILSIDQQEGFSSQTDDGDIPKWKVGTRPTSFNPGLPFFLPLPPWQWIHGESGGIWAVIHYLPKAPTPENSQIWQGIVRSGYDTEIGRIQLRYLAHHPHFYAH